jgi:hypothetical protein
MEDPDLSKKPDTATKRLDHIHDACGINARLVS